MLRALEPLSHVHHLQELMRRFRGEELSMQAALQEMQAELELLHRETANSQIAAAAHCEAQTRRCAELQEECDHLAIELVHVRLAIAGVREELADNSSRRGAVESVA